jgi:hypothetical protein
VTSLAALLAANVVLAALGAGALMAAGTWDRLPPLSRIGPSLVIGFAGAAVLLPPLLYLGVAPTPLVVIALAAAALATGMAVRRTRHPGPLDRAGGGLLVGAIVAALVAPLVVRAATEPLVKFDAYADWSLKAKLIYGHGGLILGAFDPHTLGSYYQAAHREYPLGFPTIEAFDFHLAGGAGSRIVHLQVVLLFLAFVATVWSLLRYRVHPAILAGVACLLIAAPSLHAQILSAYADVPMSCLWALAALSLGLWLAGDGADRLVLATVLAAGALAIKQEGLVMDAALFSIAVLTVGLRRDRGRLIGLAAAASVVVASGLPWQLRVRALGLHDADIAPSAGRMLHQAHLLPTILHRLGGELLWTRWPGVVPLAVAVALWLAWTRRDAMALAFLGLLGTTALGLVFIYWNAAVPVQSLLAESARRVVTAPVLLSVAVLPLMLERLARTAPVEAARPSAVDQLAELEPDAELALPEGLRAAS